MAEAPGHECAFASVFEQAFRDGPNPFTITTVADTPFGGSIVYANPPFWALVGKRELTGQCYRDVWQGTEASLRRITLHDAAGRARYCLIAHADEGGVAASTVAQPALLACIGTGVLVHRNFRPLYVNPAGARMFGFETPEELLAEPTMLRFVPLETYRMALERNTRSMSEGVDEAPYIVRCLDGAAQPLWMELRESLVDWQGEKALAVSLVDAGDHVRARKSEALLREAIDNLSDSFILYDANDRVVLTNRRFHELFPFVAPQDKIAGTPMVDLVRASVANGVVTDPALRDDNVAEWIGAFIEARHANKLSLAEDRWPDGRWDLVKEQRLESGGFVSVRTDITDRKRAEFALKNQEVELERALAERTTHLEAVLANVAEGIVVLSPDLRIVLTNDGLHELVGYPRELGKPGTHVSELIRNRLWHGLFLPGEEDSEEDIETLVEQRLEAYRTLTRECYQHVFPNGRLVEIRREKLADGTIVCTFTDVTERVNTERELQTQREALYQREKLSALGMLLAGVAHELNNPLSVVLGQATLMESFASDESARDRARRIRAAAERCARIIKTFLSMARDEPGSRAPLDVGHLVGQALEIVGYQFRSNDIEVSSEVPGDLPCILGDGDQLNQVIVNLLINALQALEDAPEPRRVAVRTRNLAANDEVEIEVSDTGPGVPEDLRRRIFDPFFTTKPPGTGTGVGLAVCHGMVTAHGGSITVDEAPGGGARFRVRVPTGSGAKVEAPVSTPSHAVEGRGRVLIVDDEPEIGELLTEFLERTGFRIEVARSGPQAMEYVAVRDYDAIVCDLRMPEMDGPAFYAEVERLKPHLKGRFIFATGDLLTESSTRFLESCGRPCLEKPFLPEQVRRIVTQVAENGGIEATTVS